MMECFVKGRSLSETYHEALLDLCFYGEEAPCADWDTTQKEVSMTMVVEEPLSEPMISKLFIGGPRELEQYRQEMLDGILDFEIEKGNWVYTYHDRMVRYPASVGIALKLVGECSINEFSSASINQINFVIDELKRNPSSRRAVIVVRDPSVDVGSDDPSCLQHIQYLIRDGKLECKVLFRSNDACKASFMNSFALIMLQKRIADELGVEVGSYTLRANSWHCYEKDFEMLEGYKKRILKAKSFMEDDHDGIYYVAADYVGDWDEMMEEYKPEIAELVRELREG